MSDDEIKVVIGGSKPPEDIEPPVDPENPANPDLGADGPKSSPEAPETTTVAPVVLSSGAVTTGKTIVIKCADCETERVIKPQDVFQVKRCIPCQKKYRNKQRSEVKKAKRKAEAPVPVAVEQQAAVEQAE